MPSGIGLLNLRVVLFDSDIYAMQALNSYLAWDRRTRVMFMTHRISELWDYLRITLQAELPDIIVLDSDHLGGAAGLRNTIRRIHELSPQMGVVCMVQSLEDPTLAQVAAEEGAKAFLLKNEVRLRIAWAICATVEHDMIITSEVQRATFDHSTQRLYNAFILPEQRDYPEMTDRIRQAIRLCVIEGMPAHLAADEMGISLHTIRGYIKEGYRILEANDHYEYPTDMTPQERAFMRFTALADER
ncbi:MAG: response regulator transcription factor [Anaerolineae bacterium]|nr:response regulator transcription factor [Anaerolineae bacterium]